MHAKARAAVNAAQFESFLPSGECDDTTVLAFLHHRREEIVTAARRALNDYAGLLPTEVVLRLLYGEVTENDFIILAAA